MTRALIVPLILILSSTELLAWGANGHRVVGEIAEQYLSRRAKKQIKIVTGGQSLVDLANWPDHIKSYEKYKSYSPWHYTTVEDGKHYHPPKNPRDGSAIEQIKRINRVLAFKEKSDAFNYKQNLAWLVHLIGDVHQPLHVGRVGTRGGNRVYVKWFGRRSNLHAIWDFHIIAQARMSYTEIAASAIRLSKKSKWNTDGSAENWANESVALRNYTYDFITERMPDLNTKPAPLAPVSSLKDLIKTDTYTPPGKILPNLSYSYQARNYKVVEQRLYQAGVRLAKMLNAIYKEVELRRK